MALPKIKFVRSRMPVEDAQWRGALFCMYDARAKSAGRLRDWRLLISLQGLCAWLAALAVAAYFIGAGALWLWLDRKPYNYVSYADLALPGRWSQLQGKRGQSQIAEGLENFKAGKWREGEMKLRIGLARAPNDAKARLELARFYLMINQRALAKSVLTGGLAYGYPGAAYIQQICALAADAEDYAWWISSCDTVLSHLGDPARKAERNAVLQQKLSALMAAGRPDEVIKLVEAQENNRTRMFDEFKVLALINTGRPDAAVAFLDEWRKRGGNREQIVRLQVRAFREAQRPDDMDRALKELRGYTPAAPQPYIYGAVQYLLAGRTADGERWIEDFLMHFGSSFQSLVTLVNPLAEIGARPQLERLVDFARQQGFDTEPVQDAVIKVLFDKGAWREGRVLLADVRSRSKAPAPALVFWYELMDRLSSAAVDPGEGTQSSLTDFVRSKRMPLKTYRELIGALRRAGRPATARELIIFAQGAYPENPSLATWRDELDREIAAAQKPVTPVVVLPKVTVAAASPELPAPVREELKQDDFFKELTALEQSGNFAGALKQIQAMRESRPEWLAASESEVEVAEIRLNGRLGDLPALHLAASLYINGDGKRSLKAAELARELYAAGAKEAAILLAKDLLRKVPNYPPAKRMLSEWEPKTEATKP